MKTIALFLTALFSVLNQIAHAQRHIIYENDFTNYSVSEGWIMHNLDGDITSTPGRIANSYLTEIINYGLGLKKNDTVSKAMISPPIVLNEHSFIEFYSNINPPLNPNPPPVFSFWILPDPNDTLPGGQADSIALVNPDGFNIFNLIAYANSTVRFMFKFTGITRNVAVPSRPLQIDDIKVFDRTRLAFIPDTCFRNYLVSIIPEAFQNDSLDFTHPSAVKLRRIEHPNSCIATLEGIEYFPNLRTLKLPFNRLYSIPVPELTYLDSFCVNNNYLEKIPDIPWARFIDYSYNLARNIPEYSNQNLARLDIHHNQIYGCLKGSNRFARGSLKNNISIYSGTYVYYNLLFDFGFGSWGHPHPDFPVPACGQARSSVSGYVYFDANMNGVFDSTDYPIPYATVISQQSTIRISNHAGFYSIIKDSGDVNVEVVNLPPFTTYTNPLDTFIVPNQHVDHNFRVVSQTDYRDVSLAITVNRSAALPDQEFSLCTTIRNYSMYHQNVTVKFGIPHDVTFLDAPNLTIIGDTAYITATLDPFGQKSFSLGLIAGAVYLNQNVIITGIVYCDNDADTSNNSASRAIFIGGRPHDPNNKLVSTPVVDSAYADYLVYTINFENIGTGNATHVIVRDRLDSLLDPTSFEFLGSTHPCIPTFGLNNLIQFTFSPITLTPTSVNPDSSHGTLWYRIKPNNPLMPGDTIFNSASIIFDMEPAISTNVATVWVEKPKADFITLSSPVICTEDTLHFYDTSTGFPLRWEWTFSGGSIASSEQKYPAVSFDTPGLYDVTLITHWVDKTDTLFRPGYVRVVDTPPAELIVSGPLEICEGDSVVLSAALENATYLWSDGSAGRTNVVTESGSRSFTIAVGSGCSSTSEVVTVEVKEAPSPVITGDSLICEGLTSEISTPDMYVDYLWSTGDTINIINQPAGTYYLDVSFNNGCTRRAAFTIANYPKPNINLPEIVGLCEGDTAFITAASDFTAYRWSTGDTTASVTLTSEGFYNVLVTDSFSCSYSDTLSISLLEKPAATILGSVSFCEGNFTTLSVEGTFASTEWSTGQLNVDSITVSNTSQISLIVTAENSCRDSATVNVVAHANPDVVISGPTTFCEGTAVLLYAESGFAEYQWSTEETGNNSITVSRGGVISLTVVDENSCTDTATVTITEYALPEVSISGPVFLCEGDSVTLSATSGFQSYNWSVSESNSANVVTKQFGNVTVTVSDDNECIGNASIEITEIPVPAFTIVGNNYFCEGSSTIIAVDGKYRGYIWNKGDTTASITVSSGGDYTVVVTGENMCQNSASFIITELPLPEIVMTGFTEDILCIHSSNPVAFSAIPEGGIFSGNAMNGNIFYPDLASPGLNYITYSYTDSFGCSAFSHDSIFVDNCTAIITAEVHDAFNVYPNPTESVVKIAIPEDLKELSVSVRNVIGEELLSLTGIASQSVISVDLSPYATGLYLITVNCENVFKQFKVIRR